MWVKAAHIDELAFLFGWNHFYPDTFSMTEAEKVMAHTLQEYWTGFAQTG